MTKLHPATHKEKTSLKGIIYGILDTATGKWYIGQTIQRFNQRYPGGRFWDNPPNPYAAKIFRKRPDKCIPYILAGPFSNKQTLDSVEKRLIAQYKALYPSGLNFEEGGQRYGKRINEETRKRISRAQKRRYTKVHVLYGPYGGEYRFKIIKDFAKKHSLNEGSISAVLKGRKLRHKGFRLDRDLDPDKRFSSSRRFKLIGPDGAEHQFYNAVKFAKKHDIHAVHLYGVLNGLKLSAKGFRLPRPRQSLIKDWKGSANPKAKYKSVVLEKNGHQITVTNIKAFAKQAGMAGNAYALINGKLKTCKGYTLININPL